MLHISLHKSLQKCLYKLYYYFISILREPKCILKTSVLHLSSLFHCQVRHPQNNHSPKVSYTSSLSLYCEGSAINAEIKLPVSSPIPSVSYESFKRDLGSQKYQLPMLSPRICLLYPAPVQTKAPSTKALKEQDVE